MGKDYCNRQGAYDRVMSKAIEKRWAEYATIVAEVDAREGHKWAGKAFQLDTRDRQAAYDRVLAAACKQPKGGAKAEYEKISVEAAGAAYQKDYCNRQGAYDRVMSKAIEQRCAEYATIVAEVDAREGHKWADKALQLDTRDRQAAYDRVLAAACKQPEGGAKAEYDQIAVEVAHVVHQKDSGNR